MVRLRLHIDAQVGDEVLGTGAALVQVHPVVDRPHLVRAPEYRPCRIRAPGGMFEERRHTVEVPSVEPAGIRMDERRDLSQGQSWLCRL